MNTCIQAVLHLVEHAQEKSFPHHLRMSLNRQRLRCRLFVTISHVEGTGDAVRLQDALLRESAMRFDAALIRPRVDGESVTSARGQKVTTSIVKILGAKPKKHMTSQSTFAMA